MQLLSVISKKLLYAEHSLEAQFNKRLKSQNLSKQTLFGMTHLLPLVEEVNRHFRFIK